MPYQSLIRLRGYHAHQGPAAPVNLLFGSPGAVPPREVRLRGADGNTVTVVSGLEVRNLPQLAAGDMVPLTYFERPALRVVVPVHRGDCRREP